MLVDPLTGYIYIHVIPNDWGPYVDIRACWQELSKRLPYVHVFSNHEFFHHWPVYRDDPRYFFILWSFDLNNNYWHDDRKCKLGTVYVEALDDDESKMLPNHLRLWKQFQIMASRMDFIFVHTPWMKSRITKLKRPTFILPAGWDPVVMGQPRRDHHSHTSLTFHGSMIGRRDLLIPWLELKSSKHQITFKNLSGSYGKILLGQLENSQASLYIAHSEVKSYSTWRLWQIASTSSTLISEPGDTWPFMPDRHYFEIPRFTLSNADNVFEIIVDCLAQRDKAIQLSDNAHQLAKLHTVDNIHNVYLVRAALMLG